MSPAKQESLSSGMSVRSSEKQPSQGSVAEQATHLGMGCRAGTEPPQSQCKDGRVQLRSTRATAALTPQLCLENPRDCKDFSASLDLPPSVSRHTCQLLPVGCRCQSCSWWLQALLLTPKPIKGKTMLGMGKTYSGFPEHSTHRLWAL